MGRREVHLFATIDDDYDEVKCLLFKV